MNWKLLVLAMLVIALAIPDADAWLFGRRRRRRRHPPPPPPPNPCKLGRYQRFTRLSGNNLHNLARVWAPAVKLARGEAWKPSSVNFFLPNVNLEGQKFNGRLTASNLPICNDRCFLITKHRLSCASCTNLPWLHGQSPARAHVPVYTFIKKERNVVEFIYRFFFPYNRGKRVCVGYMLNNFCPCPKTPWGCMCPRITKCVGKHSTFGHHIADWETIKIRFENNKLHSMFLSTHNTQVTNDNVGTFRWNGRYFQKGHKVIKIEGCTHGVAYAADGSHGFWNAPGNHVYKKLKNGERLTDKCSRGEAWNTWKSLKITNYQNDRSKYRGGFSFVRYKGRWGNHERKCGLAKKLFGVCILEDGPHMSF